MQSITKRCFDISTVTRYVELRPYISKSFDLVIIISILILSLYLQNEDGGWGLHIESKSFMFTTVLTTYACVFSEWVQKEDEKTRADGPGNGFLTMVV